MKHKQKIFLFLFALLVIVQFSGLTSAVCPADVPDTNCCAGRDISFCEGILGVTSNACQTVTCLGYDQICEVSSSCDVGYTCQESTATCVLDSGTGTVTGGGLVDDCLGSVVNTCTGFYEEVVEVSIGSGGPYASCFIRDTQVIMSDGTQKNIQDVVIGDVLKGETTNNKVISFHRPILGEDLLYSFNGGKYFVTEEHPFMTSDGWKAINPTKALEVHNLNIEIGVLKLGDTLITENGKVILETIESESADTNTQLYNFILDGDRTYYADNYLVHNKDGCDVDGDCGTTTYCYGADGYFDLTGSTCSKFCTTPGDVVVNSLDCDWSDGKTEEYCGDDNNWHCRAPAPDIRIDRMGEPFEWISGYIYRFDGSFYAACEEEYINAEFRLIDASPACIIQETFVTGTYYTPYTLGSISERNWKTIYLGDSGEFLESGIITDWPLYGPGIPSKTVTTIEDCADITSIKECGIQSECTWESTCDGATVVSTSCSNLGEGSNDADPLIVGTSIINTVYSDASSADTVSLTDKCDETNTSLIEYSCTGVTDSEAVLFTTIPCTYGCSNGLCNTNTPCTTTVDCSGIQVCDATSSICVDPVTEAIWVGAQSGIRVTDVNPYTISMAITNPGLIETTNFDIYESDGSTSGLLGSVSATIVNGELTSSNIFTTDILNSVVNNGEGPYFDFFFNSSDFPGVQSEILQLWINKTDNEMCFTETENPALYANGECDSGEGEVYPNCPLDCWIIDDEDCNRAAGENSYNSISDCPLDSVKRVAWMDSSTKKEIKTTVSISESDFTSREFTMAYMTIPNVAGIRFAVYGYNSNNEWQLLEDFLGAENSDGVYYRDFELDYNYLWDLGYVDSTRDFDFKFISGGVESEILSISLIGSGNIPLCTDAEQNGAETGTDCNGDCPDSCPAIDGPLDYCVTTPPAACSDYNIDYCDSNACGLTPNNGAVCYWDTDNNKCDSKVESDVGTCYYQEDPREDDCEDGYFSYTYKANFVWKDWVVLQPLSSWTTGYTEIDETTYYYDPQGDGAACEDGAETIACPAQIKLSFWTWQNILATVALIFLGYYILGTGKKEKVKVKKKVVKKSKK